MHTYIFSILLLCDTHLHSATRTYIKAPHAFASCVVVLGLSCTTTVYSQIHCYLSLSLNIYRHIISCIFKLYHCAQYTYTRWNSGWAQQYHSSFDGYIQPQIEITAGIKFILGWQNEQLFRSHSLACVLPCR